MMLAKESGSRMTKGTFASRDGVLVEYCHVDNGSGRTIAFINGWGTTTYSEWSKQMRIRGYDLLFYNNRGNGGSGLGDGDYIRQCASDLCGICGSIGVSEVNLAGHSMGGLIETMFYNEFRSAVAVRTMTFVSSPDDDPIKTFPYRFLLFGEAGVRRLMKSYENGLLGDLASIAERSGMLEKAAFFATYGGGVHMGERAFSSLYHNFLSRRKADVAALRSMREDGHTLGASMARIAVPALIVHARGDFFVSPEAALRIHQRIAGSELHLMERSTHAPMFEQPSEFNRIFLEFLDAHNAPAKSAA